ncbi:hypothetical protein [Oceanibaculum nanhaiense]|uniref:hypothetical protein n=2 Tax=Oceanibaculum nanhaiense TaxID=1909734 RepID=UPI00396D9CB1
MILDRLLGLIALAFFIGFIGIIALSVKQPALIVVAVIGCALVVYDFWRQLVRRQGR